MRKFTLLLACAMLMAFKLVAQTPLVPFGSTWKYLDNGSDQGTAWQAASFDDASWKTGNGKFGYGNTNNSTLISYGPDPSNAYITAYFRKAISVGSGFTSYTGKLKRDDGAVVYVNGVEVFRSSMPTGTIAYNTLAKYANDNGTVAQSFTIPASAFVNGTNVIAVEIHQVSKTSSDMTFDLELTATGGTAPADETPPTVLSLNRHSPTTESTNATSLVFRATFSEAVTGVDATDFALALSGTATGTIGSVAPVGSGNNIYDVTVNSVSGSGTLGLNLKSSGTGIADAAGNPISGGFTGQTYTIQQTAPPTETAALVPFGSAWKYLDNGSDQGTAWRATSFDDASWKTGNGKFGYGNTNNATIISYGPDPSNAYITAYFRKAISFASGFTSYTGKLKRDDGAVVYVNGVEVFRSSMPTGTIAYNTVALYASDNGTVAQSFTIPASAFVNGTNVIAVEIHQVSKTSSDMTFDLELTATGGTAPADETPPTVLSLNRQSPTTESTNATSLVFRATFSEAVTGVDATDFALALSGTATGTIGSVAPVGSGNNIYDVTVNSVSGSGTLGLNLKSSGTGIADAAGNPISGGFTGQTYTIDQPPADQTPPAVLSLNRQSPSTQTTGATSLIFRATFSEAVTGVDATDFALALSGSASGTIASAAPVGSGGATYDITVNGVSGSGTLGLNLKSSGTGIADAAGNPIGGGFTGQTYTIHNSPGFASVTALTPLAARADATREKEQSKVFKHADRHWAVIAKVGGTYLFRLDGTTWTEILLLSTRNNRSDAVVDGNLVHVLMYGGSPTATPPNVSQFITLEYVPETNTYRPWTVNPNLINIQLDAGIETASLAKDGTGRLWIANAGISDIIVRSSVSPYNDWGLPQVIATGVNDDDIAAAVYMPTQQKLGVFWSNQTTRRFGFKTHQDGAPIDTWSGDEIPGSAAAIDGDGGGMADDHMNFKVGSDGTLYASVKTSYDIAPEIGLLVRRPNGTWDPAFYAVAVEGTLPIVVLNETIGRLRVVYTAVTNGGDIVYQESSLSNISFGGPIVLISGVNNNATSTHQNFSTDVVILASDATQVVGVLASDSPSAAPRTAMTATQAANPALEQVALQQDLLAFPNPFSSKATLSFTLTAGGAYSLTVYEGTRMSMVYQKQGQAQARALTKIELGGEHLARGLYYARLQTSEGTKTLRLILDR